jgi:hypothetical protein
MRPRINRHTKAVVMEKPWEREAVHYTDVPVVVMRLYGIRISARTVTKWMKLGRKALRGDFKGQKVLLASFKVLSTNHVRIVDLKAFCETT